MQSTPRLKNNMDKVEPALIALNKVITEQKVTIANLQKQNNDLKSQVTQLKKANKVNKVMKTAPPQQRGIGRKARALLRNGHIGVIRQGGAHGEIKPGSIWRGNSGSTEPSQGPATPDGQGGSISSISVGPTLLRSFDSVSITPSEADKTDDHGAGPSTTTAPEPKSRTGSNPLAIGPQSLWARYANRRGERVGLGYGFGQTGRQGPGDGKEQGEMTGGIFASDSGIEAGGVAAQRQSVLERNVVQLPVQQTQNLGPEGSVERQQQRQGLRAAGQGQDEAEAGPSTHPAANMFFSSAGRDQVHRDDQ
jgi:uncharacterized coiled-coil protein SlyX